MNHSSLIDMAGKKIGKWTVIRYDGRCHWLCRCVCGKEKAVGGGALRAGDSKQCEDCRKANSPVKKHGGWKTRLFRIWGGMKDRCHNKNGAQWERYGARGISVCREWRHDFSAFRDWALNNGYSDDLTIERRDVDGGYNPKNCTWIPLKEQARNRGNTVLYRWRGEDRMLKDLAKEYDMNYATLHSRLWKGWPLKKALLVPVDHSRATKGNSRDR